MKYLEVGWAAGATLTMLSVAAGDIEEAAFADWIRQHMQLR